MTSAAHDLGDVLPPEGRGAATLAGDAASRASAAGPDGGPTGATRAAGGPSRWGSWVLVLVVLATGIFELHNLDIYLHARTGQWIVENGQVPTTNVMSPLHGDHPTVQDKWLFQVGSHLVFDRWGANACILLRVVLMAVLFAVMASTARRLGASEGALVMFLVLAALAGRARFMFRPGLVSMVLLVVTVHFVLVRRPDGRRTWPLLLLQLLWANLHGYFILGPVAVLGVAAGRLFQRDGRIVAARLGLLVLALIAVCFVNPAGVDGVLHPVSILTDLREHYDFYSGAIVEFRGSFAPDVRHPLDQKAFFALGGAALVLLLWAGARELGRRRANTSEAGPNAGFGWALPGLVLLAGFGFMTVSLRRNMAPFVFVVAPLAAAAWTGLLGARTPGRVLPLLLAAALVAGEVTDATSVHDQLPRRTGWGLSQLAYPDEGIAFIGEQLPDARVYTAFRYGSSFTGRRWPAQAAATDGNTHGYPTSWLMQVMGAASGEDRLAFDRLCSRHELSVALVPMAEPLSVSLLARDDWTLVCLGRQEAVFVQRDAVPAEWLAEHDLEARLDAGQSLTLPDTPPRGHVLVWPRSWVPLAEIDQTLLLMAGGHDDAAFERCRDALAGAPDDANALGLCGLLAARLGRLDEARTLLERSLAEGVDGGLAKQVVERLDSL